MIEKDETVIKQVDQLDVGDKLQIRLADGHIETVVDQIMKDKE